MRLLKRRSLLAFAAVLAIAAAALLGAVAYSNRAAALGLQIRPLYYRATISPNEVKKGFLDIANPGNAPLTIELSVRAFKQDSSGNLSFYDSAQISAGIITDAKTIKLGPRESWRVFFTIDGRKLPGGDVFAAIFATTAAPAAAPGSLTARVQVGTLLVLQNGSPGPRQAAITAARVAWLQTGEGISGRLTVKNTGSGGGYFADGTLRLSPSTFQKDISGPLVMAGVERRFDFNVPVSRLGLYKLDVQIADAHYSRWVVMITGFWRWLLPLILATAGLLGWVVRRLLVLKKRAKTAK